MAYVRVKDKDTGHELSLSDVHGINEDAYEVLTKADAVDAAGDPLPVKYADAPAAPPARITGDYDTHTVTELRSEIVARNTGRPADEQIPTSGVKADLVSALENDDEENDRG